MDVKDHYENHLSNYYSWMFGDFNEKLDENRSFFMENNIRPKNNKIAFDLGSGCGFQAIPLAELGFEIKAVDFSEKLLKELNAHKENLKIETIESDLIKYCSATCIQNPELIVCMGDTITHLMNIEKIEELLENCYKILINNGIMIISYRDLSFELKEEQRFITVRSTNDRIFTCFLEYFSDHVKVYDLIYEQTDNGWNKKISSYNKIKLPQNLLENIITKIGYTIFKVQNKNGFISMIIKK